MRTYAVTEENKDEEGAKNAPSFFDARLTPVKSFFDNFFVFFGVF